MTTTSQAPVAASRGLAATRLPSLTGLRFIAALLVFLYHAHWLGLFAGSPVEEVYNFVTKNGGYVGVSFFFVLSGFVLTWAAKPGDKARKFWRRRFFKIIPNHVVAFAFAFAMLLGSGSPIQVSAVIANLFLVHTWVPDLSLVLNAVSGVTWSLSVELFFYISFPLLIVLVRKIRPERLWYWWTGLVTLALLMPVLSGPLLPTEPRFPFDESISWPQMWLLDYGPPVRVLEFASGMVLARIVLSGRLKNLPALLPALLAVGVYVVSLFVPTSFAMAAIYPVPLGLLIAAVALRDVRGATGFLAGRPMRWLGEISYAFFLLHFTLLFALHGLISKKVTTEGVVTEQLGGGPVGGALFLVGAFAVSLLASWVLYRAVEMPAMRRWSKSRADRRAAAAAKA
ncbi:acyltransferase family protein [Amycolatopsis sp. NPDC004747]